MNSNTNPSPRPSVLAPFLNLFLCFLIVTALSMTASLLAPNVVFALPPYVITLLESVIYAFCAWWFYNFNTAEITALFATHEGHSRQRWLAVAMCAACYFLAESALLSLGGLSLGGTSHLYYDSLFSKIGFLAAGVLIAPLAEELLFRGYFQSRLTTTWGPAKAIAASGLVFGFMHSHVFLNVFGYLLMLLRSDSEYKSLSIALMGAPADLTALIMTMAYKISSALIIQGLSGVLFGYLFYKIKSLWAPWIAHATMNLFAALNLNYETLEYAATEILKMHGGTSLAIFVILASLAGLVRSLRAVR